MRSRDWNLDRIDVAVWTALVLTGAAAWFGSGTPIAGAAIVVAVILASASPSGALLAACGAIPLIYQPIDVGSLQLGLLEIAILATAMGTAIRLSYDFVANRSLLNFDWSKPWSVWVLPLLLLGLGTLSIAWMPSALHRAEALRSWRWIVVEPVIVFALARMAIARNGTRPLALAIAAPASVVATAAIWQFARDSSSFSVDDVHRSTSTYLHPNNLALYLERAFFLAFVPALFLKGRTRWSLLCITGLILAGIGVSFSRGALVGLAVGGAVVLLARPFRRGWFYLGSSLVAVGIGFGMLASQRFTGADSSGLFSTRRYLWSDSVDMIRDFPLTGIGLDQFLWMHQQRYIDPIIWSERYVSHPHNIVLDAWLSLGIPGLALLLGFVAVGCWVIWAARSGRRRLDPIQLGALGCLGAGLGHGLVDNGYFLPDLAVLTWLAIAMVCSYVDQSLPAFHD